MSLLIKSPPARISSGVKSNRGGSLAFGNLPQQPPVGVRTAQAHGSKDARAMMPWRPRGPETQRVWRVEGVGCRV